MGTPPCTATGSHRAPGKDGGGNVHLQWEHFCFGRWGGWSMNWFVRLECELDYEED